MSQPRDRVAPTTPITAQLEKLLSPQTSLQSFPPAPPGNASTTSLGAGGSRSQSPTVGGTATGNVGDFGSSDPSAALDNLFAARFSFQFDNLQHILRYILGEMRQGKKNALEVEKVRERMTNLEIMGEALGSITAQSNVCKKHNTHVSATLSRLEDRVTKEGILVNRRLAALEVHTEKLGAEVANQGQVLSKQASRADLADGATGGIGSGSARESLASSGGLSNIFGTGLSSSQSASKRDLGEIDGMSAQISKFLAQQGKALEVLQEKVKSLEEFEHTAKKNASDAEVKLVILQNENKRLQEKVERMEDQVEEMKKQPPPQTVQQVVVAPTQAPIAASGGHTPVTTQPLMGSFASKRSTGAAAGLPLPTRLTGSASGENIQFEIDMAAGLKVQHGLTPATSQGSLHAGETHATGGGVSEAQLTLLQTQLEAGYLSKVADLRKDIDDQLALDKEAARDHRRAVMEAVTQAGECALDAKNARERAEKLVEEIEAKLAQVGSPRQTSSRPVTSSKTLRPSSDAQAHELLDSTVQPREDLVARGRRASTGFAGQESVPGAPAVVLGQASPAGSPQLSSVQVNKERSPSPVHGGVQSTKPPTPGSLAASVRGASRGGHTVASAGIDKLDFDRVKAMAELALRRTVQHGESLAMLEGSSGIGVGSSGFKKDPLANSVTRLDLDKVKAGQTNISNRVLYVEDKLETLNALTLATRNQTSALATAVEDNPVFKSIHLRLFENELRFSELGDKVKLLAHMLARGGAPGGATLQGDSTAQSDPKKLQPSTAQQSAATTNKSSLANPRSLVSTLAAEEKQAMDRAASQTSTTGGATAGVPESDEDTSRSISRATSRAQFSMNVPISTANRRPSDHGRGTSKGGYGYEDSHSHSQQQHQQEHLAYTDELDENASSLAMVLRDGAGQVKSVEQVTKDLKALGNMEEKLTSIENLDAKLSSLSILEGKVESLLDLDLKERLTFIERRFNTELTFLRSHVNTKVDSSSLKILLDKIDLEDGLYKNPTIYTQPQSAGLMHSPRKMGGGQQQAADEHSPTRGGGGVPDEGSMGRASGRESRGRAAGEVDRAARERKQRLAHLLGMLDKKADHSAIRAVEEFVRSIDRHLRGTIQQHAAQLKQLEAQGFISPVTQHGKKSSIGGPTAGPGGNNGGKVSTQVKGWDEDAKTSTDPAMLAAHVHDPLYDAQTDDIWAAEEIEYAVQHNPDEMGGTVPQRRQAIQNMLKHGKGAQGQHPHPHHGGHEDESAAARIGFTVSSTPAQISLLQKKCEDLQLQIAALHGLLAKKQDRGSIAGASDAEETPTQGPNTASNPLSTQVGSNQSLASSLAHATSSGLTLSLDGLSLNPNLSLLEHPHVARTVQKQEQLDSDLSHLQALVMYQSKQLRNHREWIAKHSREIGALREFVKYAQQANLANGPPIVAGHQGANEQNAAAGTGATVATAAAYPSPAVYQLLRQVEQDILSLRRSLRQKLDFSDLGISNPHDSTQALPISSGNYPHPSLEDLRRLIFYLTPQLNAGGGVGLTGAGSTGGFGSSGHGFSHSSGGAVDNRVSMLATKGQNTFHVPPMDGLQHTHGPGGPDTWKCLACDRAMDHMNTTAGGKVSRHANLTSTLSSVAPAGGLVGANTRRLIAQTNAGALFQGSPRIQGAPPGGQQQKGQQQHLLPAGASDSGSNLPNALQPRPPQQNQIAGSTSTPRSASRLAGESKQNQQQPHHSPAGSSTVKPSGSTSSNSTSPSASEVARQAKEREEKLARRAERKRAKEQAEAAAAAAAVADQQQQAVAKARASPPPASVGGDASSSASASAAAAQHATTASKQFNFIEIVESARREQLGKTERLTQEEQDEEDAKRSSTTGSVIADGSNLTSTLTSPKNAATDEERTPKSGEESTLLSENEASEL